MSRHRVTQHVRRNAYFITLADGEPEFSRRRREETEFGNILGMRMNEFQRRGVHEPDLMIKLLSCVCPPVSANFVAEIIEIW